MATTQAPVLIREFQSGDLQGARDVFWNSMSNMVPESHPFLPLYRLYGQHALTIDMADIEGHYMKHERRCFWVAVLPDTNEVVGCVALEPHASDSGIVPIEPSEIGPDGRALRIAELRRMSVSAAHRGKQIATRLLDRTSEWARANGFTSIRLTCSEFQYAAIQLYERYGYKVIHKRPFRGPPPPPEGSPPLIQIQYELEL